MTEQNTAETRPLIPLIRVLDFVGNRGPLSSRDRFRTTVKDLVIGEVPKYFPDVPNFIKASNMGITTNYDYRNSQLALPIDLFNSDTYIQYLALRGPMEEIILAYEKQRILLGLPRNKIWGNDWTSNFQEQFEALTPPIGPIEEEILRELELEKKLPMKLSGRNNKGILRKSIRD